MWRWRADRIAALLVSLAVLGALIRLTVRDTLAVTAPIFYSLPLLVLAILTLGAALAWWRAGRPGASLAGLLAALVLAAAWLAGSHAAARCSPRPGDLRVTFWNVARGRAGWEPVAAAIRAMDADIIGLVEAGGAGPDRHAFWGEQFPGHQVLLPGGGLVLLIRGRITGPAALMNLGRRNRAVEIEAEVSGRRIGVLLLDLEANPLFSRSRLIQKLFIQAQRPSHQPTLVMGDFNTPPEGAGFDDARRTHVSAFAAAGRGLHVTWPLPLPLLALDQIWIPRSLPVRCAVLPWTDLSDHRPVMAWVGRRPEDPGYNHSHVRDLQPETR